MDFFEYFVKTIIALVIVILLIFILLPYFIPALSRLKIGKSAYEGEHVKIKKVMPLSRNAFIVEMLIRDKLVVLCIAERNVEVIYREDDSSSSGDTAY